MIGISKLYCGNAEASDSLRYHHGARNALARKPVVVWSATSECNLSCSHCYSSSGAGRAEDELSTDEAKGLVDQLSSFGCPVLLLSGGEPLMRRDLPEIAVYATSKKLHAVVSSNGTLIDKAMSGRLAEARLSYVGVSIDGLEATHDSFRRRKGAFNDALRGVRNCLDAGLKAGLRCTISKGNISELPQLFELIEQERIPRACFYHLVNSGRGEDLRKELPSREESRFALDQIIDGAARLHRNGFKAEILTVDNLSDGPYLLMRLIKEGRQEDAEKALSLLKLASGGGSGVGIGCVGWDGEVYPDQFWRNKPLGNIRSRSFGEIWSDTSSQLMAMLKEKTKHVKGRCASCRFLELCGGGFRARAEALTGDPWASDPACLLTDEEIAP